MSWESTWPKEPGSYWFHGRLYKEQPVENTYFVRATSGQTNVEFATCGVKLNSLVASGMWKQAEVPAAPPSRIPR